MTAMHAISGWIDARLNPVTVKELRQAVRSWIVIVVLMLFLVLMLLALSVYVLTSDLNESFDTGREIFLVLEAILLGTCLLFVPMYVGVRLAAERSDQNVDLLYITTLRPSAIVTGKLVSGLTLVMLIYSVCVPFMVLTYLLRGIDLPTILVALGLNLLPLLVLLQFALLLGALPTTVVLKVVMVPVLLGAIVAAFSGTLAGVSSMVFFGVGSILDTWSFWGPGLVVIGGTLALAGLLHVLAVASLSPGSSNRALPVRLYITAIVVGGGVAAIVGGEISGDDWPFTAWYFCSICLAMLALFVTICERDAPGVRVQRAIPRLRVFRSIAFLFYSGAGGGLVWALGLGGAIIATSWIWFAQTTVGHWQLDEFFHAMQGMWLYVAAYGLTGLLLHRYLLRTFKPALTVALALMLMALGCLVPMLAIFFIEPVHWDRRIEEWMILNPLGMLANLDNASEVLRNYQLVSIWLTVVTLGLLPWLMRQMRAFTPLSQSAEAPAPPSQVASPGGPPAATPNAGANTLPNAGAMAMPGPGEAASDG